jgi:hypothetical protein
LATEREATCESDQPGAAVFEAVNRALLDPVWKDGSFHVVMVIGDADPHWDKTASNYEMKNPLHLTIKGLQELASLENVRFITNRIVKPIEGGTLFETLAMDREDQFKGRFNRILLGNQAQLRQTLATTLWTEWRELVEPAGMIGRPPYAYPTIVDISHDGSAGSRNQSFTRGWVNKRAVNEFVFMRSLSIADLLSVIEVIVRHFEEGEVGGAEAFMDALRSTLAAQLKLRPEEVFAPREPLAQLLYRARILPYPRKVVPFDYVQRIATEWFRDGGQLINKHEN